MACLAMAYLAMADPVMAYPAMAYLVMADLFMADWVDMQALTSCLVLGCDGTVVLFWEPRAGIAGSCIRHLRPTN